MKKLVAVTFLAGIGLALASSAQAMSIAPLAGTSIVADTETAPTVADTDAAPIVKVFGGCGWGWHRGPFGGCRPLYNCPPGWHTGPWGRVCRPN
jgi:phosphate-selective porin